MRDDDAPLMYSMTSTRVSSVWNTSIRLTMFGCEMVFRILTSLHSEVGVHVSASSTHTRRDCFSTATAHLITRSRFSEPLIRIGLRSMTLAALSSPVDIRAHRYTMANAPLPSSSNS